MLLDTNTPHESATGMLFMLGMQEGGGPPSVPPSLPLPMHVSVYEQSAE
jgi:hypothetical protein